MCEQESAKINGLASHVCQHIFDLFEHWFNAIPIGFFDLMLMLEYARNVMQIEHEWAPQNSGHELNFRCCYHNVQIVFLSSVMMIVTIAMDEEKVRPLRNAFFAIHFRLLIHLVHHLSSVKALSTLFAGIQKVLLLSENPSKFDIQHRRMKMTQTYFRQIQIFRHKYLNFSFGTCGNLFFNWHFWNRGNRKRFFWIFAGTSIQSFFHLTPFFPPSQCECKSQHTLIYSICVSSLWSAALQIKFQANFKQWVNSCNS